jgi:hypothetical protein
MDEVEKVRDKVVGDGVFRTRSSLKFFPAKDRRGKAPQQTSGTGRRVAYLIRSNSLLFRGCNLPPNIKSRSLGSRGGFETTSKL